MSLETSSLHQFATLWTKASVNNYAEVQVNSPIQICVRWEQIRQQQPDEQSKPIAIISEVWVDREIAIGSIMWKGKKKDLPTPVTTLYQVEDYNEIPDIKGRNVERSVILKRFRETLPTII